MNDCTAAFDAVDARCQQLGSNTKRAAWFRAQVEIEAQATETNAGRSARIVQNLERAARLEGWEKLSASVHSSHGTVRDIERLRRSLRARYDFLDGRLHLSAFVDLGTVGLSCDRARYRDVASSHQAANGRPATSPGYIEMDVKDLRALEFEHPRGSGKRYRAVGVYDTATSENVAHADVIQIRQASNSVPMKDLKYNLVQRYKDEIQLWPQNVTE